MVPPAIPGADTSMNAAPHPDLPLFVTSPERKKRARTGLLVYFGTLVPLSAVCSGLAISTGNYLWVTVMMFMPAVSSIIARVGLREGMADISLRLGGRRGRKALVSGWLLPAGVGFVAYGIGWVTGLTPFTAPSLGLFRQVLPLQEISPAITFLVSLLITMTIVTLYSCPFTLGEELGWRGYMLTRLVDGGLPKPVFLSGLFWGAWHLPIIVGGLYIQGPSLPVSILLFMIGVTALGYIFAWLRLSSGSIWPCVVFHASWNAVIQATFDRSVTGPGSTFWVGEAGILVVLVLAVIAVVLSRRRWTMIRELPARGIPVQEEVLPGGLR